MTEREAQRTACESKAQLDCIPKDERLPQDYFNHAIVLEYCGYADLARIYRKFGHERKAQLMLVHKR